MTSGTAARDQGPGTGAAPRSAGTLVLSQATIRWKSMPALLTRASIAPTRRSSVALVQHIVGQGVSQPARCAGEEPCRGVHVMPPVVNVGRAASGLGHAWLLGLYGPAEQLCDGRLRELAARGVIDRTAYLLPSLGFRGARALGLLDQFDGI